MRIEFTAEAVSLRGRGGIERSQFDHEEIGIEETRYDFRIEGVFPHDYKVERDFSIARGKEIFTELCDFLKTQFCYGDELISFRFIGGVNGKLHLETTVVIELIFNLLELSKKLKTIFRTDR